MIAATTQALNAYDASAFARFYTVDAELVTVRGERMRGAAEVEKGLARIFATRAAAAVPHAGRTQATRHAAHR